MCECACVKMSVRILMWRSCSVVSACAVAGWLIGPAASAAADGNVQLIGQRCCSLMTRDCFTMSFCCCCCYLSVCMSVCPVACVIDQPAAVTFRTHAPTRLSGHGDAISLSSRGGGSCRPHTYSCANCSSPCGRPLSVYVRVRAPHASVEYIAAATFSADPPSIYDFSRVQ